MTGDEAKVENTATAVYTHRKRDSLEIDLVVLSDEIAYVDHTVEYVRVTLAGVLQSATFFIVVAKTVVAAS